MVPADCRVISAKDLFVAQAAMTGESLPVEKFADRQHSSEGILEQSNLLFMGTNIVSGVATAVVISTGNDTYFGTLAQRTMAADRVQTSFQLGVNSVSWLLIRFALVMVPIVLLLNGFTKGDWPEAFLFALSVAVGLTPEMLPMIVTSTLAKGAVMLAPEGHRQAARCDSELWCHGCAVHRQDWHPDAGQDCAGAPYRCAG